ncbi:hypothetical protein A8938_1576 [Algoriphagus zhangzhouensis]|uniref:Uncharacterized protein n=1 Tax=Algoriphagus zhangzhouensis TaxID=1073327 RepID=A0A1M7ZAG9_9BACT|nr:hypothetical protein A8938_1576 [Algoriphagus zhangzhouensis]SHO61917.1 hypothetical protein SAMN04488108_1686 [Algoriphagus zhangzhouensis]
MEYIKTLLYLAVIFLIALFLISIVVIVIKKAWGILKEIQRNKVNAKADKN